MKKYIVLVVLLNTQISFRNLVGRMVKDVHKKSWRRPVFPGMITKGFPQGVAADMLWKICFRSRFFDNAEGLITTDVQGAVFLAGEKVVFPGSGRLFQGFQGRNYRAIERNHSFLPSFLFPEVQVGAVCLLFKIIDHIPGDLQQIADAQGSVQTKGDQGIVSGIGMFLQVIVLKNSNLTCLPDWLCCTHGGFLLLRGMVYGVQLLVNENYLQKLNAIICFRGEKCNLC